MNESKTPVTPIHIHVVVGEQTTEFFDYQRANYRSMAAHPDALNFYCYALNGSTYRHYINVDDLAGLHAAYTSLRSYRYRTRAEFLVLAKAIVLCRPLLRGSNGHAAGLNLAGRHMSDLQGIQIFADADTVMLMPGWDERMRQLLRRYDIIGAPYEDIGGFSSGSGPVQTYKNIPTAYWMAWSERLDLSGMDWFPAKNKNVPIDTAVRSQTYNLPVGMELVCDVGWELPGLLAKSNHSYLAFRHVKSSADDCKVLKTTHDYHEEYQLEGEPIVGHHRGAHRHPFRKSEMSNGFFDMVESYLARMPAKMSN
jgi:hypothetical protein